MDYYGGHTYILSDFFLCGRVARLCDHKGRGAHRIEVHCGLWGRDRSPNPSALLFTISEQNPRDEARRAFTAFDSSFPLFEVFNYDYGFVDTRENGI